MSQKINKEAPLDFLTQRFDQCISALSNSPDIDEKLKPGALLYLLRHLEENILRPLVGIDTLEKYSWIGGVYNRAQTKSAEEAYGKLAQVYNDLTTDKFSFEEQTIFSLMGDIKDKRILDIGCGTGRYSLKFAECDAQVTGIDITPEMLEVARNSAQQMGVEVEWICGDVVSEILTNNFDFIFSSLAITHVSDLNILMAKLQKTLKTDGKIIISDIHPCAQNLGILAALPVDGNYLQIPRYTHCVSDYFKVAADNQLRVANMMEFPKEMSLPMFLVVVLEHSSLEK